MNISFKWRAKQISGLVSKVIFAGTRPCGRTIKVIDMRTSYRFSLMLHTFVDCLISTIYCREQIPSV